MTWEDLRALRARLGPDLFVLAPHPWYPRDTCAGPDMDANADCIDAVEWCHLHGLGFDPNRRAASWAADHHKPFITTSDAHSLYGIARNTTEVEADELTPRALFDALRAGRVRAAAKPYSLLDCAAFGFRVFLPNLVRDALRAAGAGR
jgi:predicted metal-dependent phosphoesterase TrpH